MKLPFPFPSQSLAKVFTGAGYLAAALFIGFLGLLNLRLYTPVPDPASGEVSPDAWAQLRSLRHAIENGAPDDMQLIFPEGRYFMYALYGLAWVNIGLESPEGSTPRRKALAEARWAWEMLGSSSTRSTFEAGLDPPYGAFYAAWRNHLLAGILLLQDPATRDAGELAVFQEECGIFAAALEARETPYPESYRHQSWPCDSVLGVHALRAHSVLVDDRFEPVIARWLERVYERLDPEIGLIPHKVDWQTGYTEIPARGLAQSLFLLYLAEIDPPRAQELYGSYREQFVRYRWGFPGVQEYRRGVRGAGDIDAGPLIFGVSLSASTVTIATSRVYNDPEVAAAMWQAGEALALPLEDSRGKRYALGLMPIGDAFAVWARSSTPWFEPLPAADWPEIIPDWWRWPLHMFSLFLAALCVLIARNFARIVAQLAGQGGSSKLDLDNPSVLLPRRSRQKTPEIS